MSAPPRRRPFRPLLRRLWRPALLAYAILTFNLCARAPHTRARPPACATLHSRAVSSLAHTGRSSPFGRPTGRRPLEMCPSKKARRSGRRCCRRPRSTCLSSAARSGAATRDARRSEALARARLLILRVVTRPTRARSSFSSPLEHEERPGTFACAGCGAPLFDAAAKFDSGTGALTRAPPLRIGMPPFNAPSLSLLSRRLAELF